MPIEAALDYSRPVDNFREQLIFKRSAFGDRLRNWRKIPGLLRLRLKLQRVRVKDFRRDNFRLSAQPNAAFREDNPRLFLPLRAAAFPARERDHSGM
jgi:hypothetical protein